MTQAEMEGMAYNLIVDERINARIGRDEKGKYLHLFPKKDEFLTIQAENLKELTMRYLSQR